MTQRDTVATYGEKGQRVRVLKDSSRGRVLVQWYDQGKLKKRVYPSTAAGTREAKAFAEAFAQERQAVAAGEDRGDMTVGEVWQAYAEVCFPALRPRTRDLYTERWRKWEAYIKRHTPADAIELRDADGFVTAQRKLGASMNQTRHILNVVRIVFNWARSRKYIQQNELAGYRWKSVKGEGPQEIAEHTPEEFRRIVAALDATSAHQWRPWALFTLAGLQGPRIRSARYLRWSDIDSERGVIVWPAEYMKQGEAFEQPLTKAAWEALEVARSWRERDGYTGDFVFYAARRTNRQPVYTYQSAWIALRKAEDRAGVPHVRWRAFHGFRRMAAGNIYDQAKDPLAAAEWIGDKDVKQMGSYLKRRRERLQLSKALLDASHGGGSNPRPPDYESGALPLSYRGDTLSDTTSDTVPAPYLRVSNPRESLELSRENPHSPTDDR